MIKCNRLYQLKPEPYFKLEEIERELPEIVKYTSNIMWVKAYENEDVYVSFNVEGSLICITKRIPTGLHNWSYEPKNNLVVMKALLLQDSTFKSKFIKNIMNDGFKLIG